ncbi:MAG TPA: prepilin peptidase [Polyangia bacterium]|jgi:leader peptidase (prepilin peptidase)/N-methyltransferase|nr:prepilin peptidase [Polyangia bacterium]
MTDVDGPLGLLVLPPWGWVVAGLIGALWGSFFNVAIHRLGLYESVVRPRSRCPRCSTPIAWYDNLPIFGWMLLGGKCRHCRLPISWRYPLVEILSTLLALAVYARFVVGIDAPASGLAAHFLVYFAFVGTLVVLAGVDLDHKIIPDAVTYPAIPAFFVAAVVLRDVAPIDLVLGMAIGYGGVAVTAELAYFILKREGMGYGDAKLLMLVGALLGWRAVAFTFLLAPFFGLALVIPVLVARRKKLRGVEIPYGPFLVAAAMVYVFFGRDLWALLFPA